MLTIAQLIAAGSEKLASVPSGGAGGAAPAAGAASGGAAEETKAEEKEEGAYPAFSWNRAYESFTDDRCREGGVRRGHGLRPLRLSDPFPGTRALTTLHQFRRVHGRFGRRFLHVIGVGETVAHGWIGRF